MSIDSRTTASTSIFGSRPRSIEIQAREVKVVMVGESSVGKTSLTIRFTQNHFKENSAIATIGASFLSKTLDVTGKGLVKFNIWDTAGQEKYRSIAALYYRGVDCAVIVYDITNKESFIEAKDYWIQELKHMCADDGSGLQMCIVGNKSDLDHLRQVPEEEGRELAEQYGALFFETSAKKGDNIGTAFMSLALELPEDGERSSISAASDTGNNVTYKLDIPKRRSACC